MIKRLIVKLGSYLGIAVLMAIPKSAHSQTLKSDINCLVGDFKKLGIELRFEYVKNIDNLHNLAIDSLTKTSSKEKTSGIETVAGLSNVEDIDSTLIVYYTLLNDSVYVGVIMNLLAIHHSNNCCSDYCIFTYECSSNKTVVIQSRYEETVSGTKYFNAFSSQFLNNIGSIIIYQNGILQKHVGTRFFTQKEKPIISIEIYKKEGQDYFSQSDSKFNLLRLTTLQKYFNMNIHNLLEFVKNVEKISEKNINRTWKKANISRSRTNKLFMKTVIGN